MSKAWSGGSDTRWRRFRLTILERDRWLCTVRATGCTTLAEHVDHVVPLGQGGAKYDPSNCRASCRSCNLGRPKSVIESQPEPRPVSSW